MALSPRYLADTSALTRLSVDVVREVLEPLMVEGLVATCGVVDLELGYSARNPGQHMLILRRQRALPRVSVDEATFDRALEVQGLLTERGLHRLPIPDLVLAAAAERASLAVLHYDADFERIAGVTGQSQRWVVPRGSL